ncbi:Uncharacterised protein [Legionella donaldsonii]|uniref:Uncharacterized protein n=1 Tax=Legionella donaldsonii TaxID=45060 RepID=A0A378JD52_9GAMM|nr:hypothetical protein [Legionella donaldsonii]STX44901.1 Uncharacterised protein [Legionella donaldsonii]
MKREIIAHLANEALVKIKFKSYSTYAHDWNDSTLFGYGGAKMVKKAMAALDGGDIGPILKLIKKIDEGVMRFEENDYSFYEQLYQYQFYDATRHTPVHDHTHKPADLIESHQKGLARLKEISALLKTELGIPTLPTQEEQSTKNKNDIVALLMEAIYQVTMPEPANQWQAKDFTRIRDVISFEKIEHSIEALYDGNLDPVLDLIRLIAQTISNHLENVPLFLKALEEYSEKYNPEFFIGTLSPDEVARTHQENLARLKEIHALLQSAALDPSLQFLAVVGDNQADKSKPSPAHFFFKDGANHDLLKMVMQYAGFFKMRIIEEVRIGSPETNKSLQG